MSKLYVNTIYPNSGDYVALSGNLEVSGTIKSYELRTITESTYRGSSFFGNDYTNDMHQFTGSLEISGSGITLIAGGGSNAVITLKADAAQDAADTTTITLADGGNFTVDCAADIVLDADGSTVYFKDGGTQYAQLSSDQGFTVNGALAASGSVTLGDAAADVTTVTGQLTASQGISATLNSNFDANVTLGNAAADIVTSTGQLTASAGISVPDDIRLKFGTNDDSFIEYDEAGANFLVISGSAAGVSISGSLVLIDGVLKGGSSPLEFKSMLVKDDEYIYFGDGSDASIHYDEDGTDELIISGALGGIDIQLPSAADALTIGYGGAAWMTLSTAGGQNNYTQFNQGVNIIDDTGLYFGSGFDISLEYDEDGTDTLLCDGSAAGVGLTMADDIFLYFGTGLDAKMYYDESSSDELIISGALGGIDIQLPSAADALTVGYGGSAWMTVSTAGGQSDYTQFNKSVAIIDDTGLYFGTDFDISLEYDEDGTNTLLCNGGAAGVGLTMADDIFLYFGTGLDAKIYYDEDSTDELIISGALGGISILAPAQVTDGLTIGYNAGAMMTFDTTNQVSIFNEPLRVEDNKKLYFGTNEDASIEYDENGTGRLIALIPAAGMSIGAGFHRVAQDVTVNKADSGDNTVANQMQGVFIPNNSIITRVVAAPSTLSNLGTAVYNLSISATNETAADSSVATPTEILGAGATGTEDSDGGSASDIVMSSGGVNKKVWISDTKIKTTYDAYVYVANAGTGNGTTDPSQGTLHVVIEYYGLE